MAASSRRAVLTGLGLINAIGQSPASYWDALRSGRGGIRTISSFDASALSTRFAGEIPDFDAKNYIDKKDRRSLKVMARTIQLAVSAAQLALDDSRSIRQRQIGPLQG